MAAGTDLPRFDSLTLADVDTDTCRKAALYVASQATGPEDCRDLLNVLGLAPRNAAREHGMTGYRAGCRCKTCRKANAERCRKQRAMAERGYLTEEQWQARKKGVTP